MLAIIKSVALVGLEGHLVRVEVDVSSGLPGFYVVGLPDAAVKEARDRVRTAIKNSGFDFPPRRITINLAPADIKKEGPSFDLAMAVGILAATEQIDPSRCSNCAFFGELSLDGSVRGVAGILASVLDARQKDIDSVIVPSANAEEAALVEGVKVYPVSHLKQLVGHLKGEVVIEPLKVEVEKLAQMRRGNVPDMADVKGQHFARRALEIAAAGGHNVLMLGSPGSGKTMLAERLSGILPPLSFAESLEVTKIHSLAGLLDPQRPLVVERPFRSPHHTISTAALVGGGKYPRPGEISLAHGGVLFLDELPEFGRDALEALRQPLEEGKVTISRVHSSITYPARFMLVGAMNPCPCGFLGDRERECTCTPLQIRRYLGRISGPLLDRIDMHVEVPRLEFAELESSSAGEPSAAIRHRVERARKIQRDRFREVGDSSLTCNAQMDARMVRRFCRLTAGARSVFEAAFTRLKMSARAHGRVLKVARTIADLEGSEAIQEHHIAEAVQYRALERKFWGLE